MFEPLLDGRVVIKSIGVRRGYSNALLAANDPLRKWVGATDGVSTDALMRTTRGKNWKQP